MTLKGLRNTGWVVLAVGAFSYLPVQVATDIDRYYFPGEKVSISPALPVLLVAIGCGLVLASALAMRRRGRVGRI